MPYAFNKKRADNKQCLSAPFVFTLYCYVLMLITKNGEVVEIDAVVSVQVIGIAAAVKGKIRKQIRAPKRRLTGLHSNRISQSCR